jgi:hypothetical protein
VKWAGVDRDGTSRIKRQTRSQVSISLSQQPLSPKLLELIFLFIISDVTLNDCANNPRKVFSTRTKLDLKDLGMNEVSHL